MDCPAHHHNETAASQCMDCYLLGLIKTRSHDAVIFTRLPLACVLVALSSLTVVVTRRTARLMERPSAMFITNLGVTGALIGTTILVFTAIHLAICVPSHAQVVLSVMPPRVLHIVTTLMLTCLTLDRYLALCWPLRYPALVTRRRCLMLTAASWLIPVGVLGLACVFGRVLSPCSDIRPYLVTYLIFFISAMNAIIVMYFLIAREFRRPVGGGVAGHELERVRRTTAKELMVVVMTNLLLAAPDIVTKIFLLFCPDTLPYLYHVTPHLLLVHLICFYPLYAWKNLEFRNGLMDTWGSVRKSCLGALRKFCCRKSLKTNFGRVSFRTSNSGTSSSNVSLGPVPLATSTTTTTTTTTTATATATTTTATTATTAATTTATATTATLPSSSLSALPLTLSGEDNVVFSI